MKNSDAVVPYISGEGGLLLNNYTIKTAESYKRTIGGIKTAAGILAAVMFVLSGVAAVVGGVCLNAYFGIAFFGAYYAVLPLLLAAVVAVSVFGCALLIIKIMRMTPIDVIRESN